MAISDPVTELDARFSSEDATATAWAQGRERIEEAEVFWLSTVRPDGRPHVTPLIAVWRDGAAYFCTGPDERKARNLDGNAHCVLTTGSNALHEGLDVVIEGDAALVTDDDELARLAEAYERKYGSEWHFEVQDGAFLGDGGRAVLYRIRPATILGFAKSPYGQTRWRFANR